MALRGTRKRMKIRHMFACIDSIGLTRRIFGTVRMPRKAISILKDERSLPRQLPVQRVAPRGAIPGDRRAQVHGVQPPAGDGVAVAKRRAVTPVNPREPRETFNPRAEPLDRWRRLTLPGRATGQWDREPRRGRRDGTSSQIERGTREACPGGGGDLRAAPYKATTEVGVGPGQESEGSIVAGKRGNARGAKGPWLFPCRE